jgi:hypothetical protein
VSINYSSIHRRTRSVESVGSGHKLGAYVCRFLGVCMIRDEDKARALYYYLGGAQENVSVLCLCFTKSSRNDVDQNPHSYMDSIQYNDYWHHVSTVVLLYIVTYRVQIRFHCK